MGKVFVISDTHFGHANIIKFEKEHRPFATIEEHDEELVKRWNSVVGKYDAVIHLGDVVFGRKNLEILNRLNGIKKLVLGNHDQYDVEAYLQYFTSVHASLILNHHVLTHIPVHPSQFRSRFQYNIHGHTHSKTVDDDRYICVSCEQINLTPILLDKVFKNVRQPQVV